MTKTAPLLLYIRGNPPGYLPKKKKNAKDMRPVLFLGINVTH
jgi:hypothetical protein